MSDDERVPLTFDYDDLPPRAWEQLEALRRTGAYGDTIEKVIETIIEQGIQRLIAEGVLPRKLPNG